MNEEKLREVLLDTVGALLKSERTHTDEQFSHLVEFMTAKFDRIDDRFAVLGADVQALRLQVEGIKRLDLERRVARVEKRLDALEANAE